MTGEYSQGFGSPGSFSIVRDSSHEGLPSGAIDFYNDIADRLMHGYVQFGAYQQEHIDMSHEAIRSSATAALERAPQGQPRRALILGAGSCIDIPLRDIAEAFDRTTIVDMSTSALQNAVSGLPQQSAKKVTLVGADVSGITSGLMNTCARLGEEHTGYGRFAAAAANAVRQTDPYHKQPSFGEAYDFVCSHLLLSQMGIIPAGFLYRTIAEPRYGMSYNPHDDPEGEPLRKAFGNLSKAIQLSHIDYLSTIVARTGVVHFADTYAEIVKDEQTLKDTDFNPIIDQAVPSQISRRFDRLVDRQSWYLRTTPHHEFFVFSDALAPKAPLELTGAGVLAQE